MRPGVRGMGTGGRFQRGDVGAGASRFRIYYGEQPPGFRSARQGEARVSTETVPSVTGSTQSNARRIMDQPPRGGPGG
jgi:hypothetical protein